MGLRMVNYHLALMMKNEWRQQGLCEERAEERKSKTREEEEEEEERQRKNKTRTTSLVDCV